MFQVYNLSSNNVVTLHKGDRIGQGVFVPYGLTDDDNVERIRTGGFGSTEDQMKDTINKLFGDIFK